jgi:uncharacterized protein with FMN-binding domain
MIPPQRPSTGPKLLLSFGLIIVSGAYALWQNLGAGQQSVTITTPPSNQQPTSIQITPSQSYQDANQAFQQTLANIGASTTPTPAPNTPTPTPTPISVTPTPKPTPVPTPIPVPVPVKPAGLYADGSYTGSPADAYYGIVQVKVIVTNGKIADVQFLQYPSDRSTSRYINGQAMPMLTQEAITAQSANVNGVSGATATSGAFIQSLASALALAKN